MFRVWCVCVCVCVCVQGARREGPSARWRGGRRLFSTSWELHVCKLAAWQAARGAPGVVGPQQEPEGACFQPPHAAGLRWADGAVLCGPRQVAQVLRAGHGAGVLQHRGSSRGCQHWFGANASAAQRGGGGSAAGLEQLPARRTRSARTHTHTQALRSSGRQEALIPQQRGGGRPCSQQASHGWRGVPQRTGDGFLRAQGRRTFQGALMPTLASASPTFFSTPPCKESSGALGIAHSSAGTRWLQHCGLVTVGRSGRGRRHTPGPLPQPSMFFRSFGSLKTGTHNVSSPERPCAYLARHICCLGSSAAGLVQKGCAATKLLKRGPSG